MLKNFFFWIALFWSSLVSYLCLTPSSDIPTISIPHLDKIVHSFFHFVFTILWYLFFEKQVKKSNQQKLLFVSVLLSLLFGIVIEILQTKITLTRSGDIYDIMANFVGSILAFVFITVVKGSKYIQNLSDIKSRF